MCAVALRAPTQAQPEAPAPGHVAGMAFEEAKPMVAWSEDWQHRTRWKTRPQTTLYHNIGAWKRVLAIQIDIKNDDFERQRLRFLKSGVEPRRYADDLASNVFECVLQQHCDHGLVFDGENPPARVRNPSPTRQCDAQSPHARMSPNAIGLARKALPSAIGHLAVRVITQSTSQACWRMHPPALQTGPTEQGGQKICRMLSVAAAL